MLGQRMTLSIQRSAMACMALAASISAGYAGPCSRDIARVQAEIDDKLNARAAAAPAARESTSAKMHRQPTPDSIAEAEVKLGVVSGQETKTIDAAMARARKADRAGDRSACDQALAEARRALCQ